MKFTLRLGDGQNLDRATAWICCTTNFVFPGSGSLMAGRRIGYAQAALTTTGFLFTAWFGFKFIIWGWHHWPEIISPGDDPIGFLLEVWRACRWALFGMLLFAISWLWALITSLNILHHARTKAAPGTQPPIIRQSR